MNRPRALSSRGSRVRPGTEPDTARTAPRLRLTLALLALVGFGAAAFAMFAAAADPGGARAGEILVGAACAAVAVTAAADIVVLTRRTVRGDYRAN